MKKVIKYLGFFLGEGWRLIFYNFRPLLLFIVLYNFFNYFLCRAVLSAIFSIIYAIVGSNHIGQDNASKFLLNPLILLIVVLGLIVMAVFALFEISGIVYAFHMSRARKKTTLSAMISAGLATCRKAVIPRNWLYVIYIMVLIPIIEVFPVCSSFIGVFVPRFVMNYLVANPVILVGLIIFYAFLISLYIRRIFAFNIFTLDNISFPCASGKSRRMTKKKILWIVGCLVVGSFLFYVLCVGISAVCAQLVGDISRAFSINTGFISESLRFENITALIRNLLMVTIAPVINLALVSVLFYRCKKDEGEKDVARSGKLKSYQKGLVFVIIMAVTAFAIYSERNMFIHMNDKRYPPDVIAHRGEPVKAPENTMASFKQAIEDNADWIELDVRQTKDGVLVLSHDDNLYRATGKRLSIQEMTYSEIQKLDVGSVFSKKFAGEKIPTLSQALRLCRESSVGVQIELKQTPYSDSFIRKVISEIRYNEMTDNCVITSFSLASLKKVKEIEPLIKTGYNMNIARGDLGEIKWVDVYSVEYGNISEALVHDVHEAGREIVAWTVNSERDVQYLIDSGVDGIVTDDIIMMLNAVNKADYTRGFARILRMFASILAKRDL